MEIYLIKKNRTVKYVFLDFKQAQEMLKLLREHYKIHYPQLFVNWFIETMYIQDDSAECLFRRNFGNANWETVLTNMIMNKLNDE